MRMQIFRMKKPSRKILKTKNCVPVEVQYYSSSPDPGLTFTTFGHFVFYPFHNLFFQNNYLHQRQRLGGGGGGGEVGGYVLICSCRYNKMYVLKFGRVIHLCFESQCERLYSPFLKVIITPRIFSIIGMIQVNTKCLLNCCDENILLRSE